jgi:hypothetical protein
MGADQNKKTKKLNSLSAKRETTNGTGHVLLSSAYLCTSHGAKSSTGWCWYKNKK